MPEVEGGGAVDVDRSLRVAAGRDSAENRPGEPWAGAPGPPGPDQIDVLARATGAGRTAGKGQHGGLVLQLAQALVGDPVAHEEHAARRRLLDAAYAQLPAGRSAAVDLVRKELKIRLGQLHRTEDAHAAFGAEYEAEYRAALRVARELLLRLRASGEIGDDAFHTLENDLDWLEVSDPLRAANADATG